jgi:hypothetical protein
LHSLRRTFGRAAANQKLRCLAAIEASSRISARELVQLQATLDFIRAYPDNAQVRRRCLQVIAGLRARVQTSRGGAGSRTLENSGVPGSVSSYAYSFETLVYLVRRFPRCLEIDWSELEDDASLTSTLEMLLTGVENEAMEDVQLWWGEWAARVRPAGFASDLEFLLSLFRRSHFTAPEQANLYESLGLPVQYRLSETGTGRCEVELPVKSVAYQEHDVPRERFALAAEIRRPLRKPRALGATAGRGVIDVAVRALASRNLEIHPLLNANPRDVVLFRAERGVQVALVGVLPEHRGALAALYFFLVLKNGVPIAYGPASPFLGSCELGINLFPEFRGGEIRFVYSQVMRLLHHVLDVESFYLTSYGMGDGNEEAIQSGAFWFYRKLGFSASNPSVEALAQSEEKRMRAQPGYRCSVRMLRRLSATEAHLDLSHGRCVRFPFGRLGLAVSRFIARRFDGDRAAATQRCTRDALRVLGRRSAGWSPNARRVLRDLSPLLSMMPDFPRWSSRDKTALARIIEGKAARSEAAASIRMKKHRSLSRALFALVADP